MSISPVNGSHLARNNRMFSYAPFTQAKLNPTSFVLLSVSSVVMEYFVCYFTGIFRYQFLHFICHMNSSEYKENLKRQIEEEKVSGWKEQGS